MATDGTTPGTTAGETTAGETTAGDTTAGGTAAGGTAEGPATRPAGTAKAAKSTRATKATKATRSSRTTRAAAGPAATGTPAPTGSAPTTEPAPGEAATARPTATDTTATETTAADAPTATRTATGPVPRKRATKAAKAGTGRRTAKSARPARAGGSLDPATGAAPEPAEEPGSTGAVPPGVAPRPRKAARATKATKATKAMTAAKHTAPAESTTAARATTPAESTTATDATTPAEHITPAESSTTSPEARPGQHPAAVAEDRASATVPAPPTAGTAESDSERGQDAAREKDTAGEHGDSRSLWQRMRGLTGYTPELLALTAVRRIGPGAREYVAWLRANYPDASEDRTARYLAQRFGRSVGYTGASAVLGRTTALTPAAVLTDVAGLVLAQARVALHVAAAYGQDPTDPARAAELLALQRVYPSVEVARTAVAAAATRAGHAQRDAGGSLWHLVRVLLAPLGGRGAGRALGRLIPGTGTLVSALGGAAAMESLANRAIEMYRPRGAGSRATPGSGSPAAPGGLRSRPD